MKSIPDPTQPLDVFNHYAEQIIKWLRSYYIDTLRDPFGTKRNNLFAELIKLKGTGKGKIAFVLANGPSLNNIDAEKLKTFCAANGSDIFCVNYFVNSAFSKKIDISYWVISDPRNFNFEEMDTQKAFANAQNIVKKGLFASTVYFEKLKGKTNLPVFPFNDAETSNIFSKNIDPRYPRSYVSMSAYKALAIATFFEYDRIYISGFDNTYIRNLGCDKDNHIYRVNEHFDSKAYPNLDARQMLNYKVRGVADELMAYSRLFSDLKRFKKFPIYNLDPESLTDAFPKDQSLDIYK